MTSDGKLTSFASSCLNELPESEDCRWLTDATTQGVKQLNTFLNIQDPLELIKISNAEDQPVAGPYQKHLIQLQVQVAPKNNCTSQTACDFNLKQSATFQLLLSQADNGDDKWTLVDSLQIRDTTSDTMFNQTGDEAIFNVPQRAASVNHSSFKLLPPYLVEVVVVAACIIGLTALLVHSVRVRRNGYATLGHSSRHAQVHKKVVRRVDLKRSNPVPRNEESILRHSHEKNERFAV